MLFLKQNVLLKRVQRHSPLGILGQADHFRQWAAKWSAQKPDDERRQALNLPRPEHPDSARHFHGRAPAFKALQLPGLESRRTVPVQMDDLRRGAAESQGLRLGPDPQRMQAEGLGGHLLAEQVGVESDGAELQQLLDGDRASVRHTGPGSRRVHHLALRAEHHSGGHGRKSQEAANHAGRGQVPAEIIGAHVREDGRNRKPGRAEPGRAVEVQQPDPARFGGRAGLHPAQAGGPAHDLLHQRHHGTAQGRHAQPPQPGQQHLRRVRPRQPGLHPDRGGRRPHLVPAPRPRLREGHAGDRVHAGRVGGLLPGQNHAVAKRRGGAETHHIPDGAQADQQNVRQNHSGL